jgi:hypothetical protein
MSVDEYRSYNGTTGSNARIEDDFRAMDSDGDSYLSQSELKARTDSSIR